LIVAPAVPSEEARAKFRNFEIKALPSGREYLRHVDCPTIEEAMRAQSGAPTQGACATDEDSTAHHPAFRIMLGAVVPDFRCSTTKGDFSFHEFIGRGTAFTILFSHPKDFTPVCTTELGTCQSLVQSFRERQVQLIGLSCDSVADHREWSKDVLHARDLPGEHLDFPMIADPDRSIANLLGMLDPLERDGPGPPLPARALFLFDAERKIRFSVIYPATTGRNFGEILRALDAILLDQGVPQEQP